MSNLKISRLDLGEQLITDRLNAASIHEIMDGVEPDQDSLGQSEIRHASVLLPLIEWEDAWHVLFIRRTESMPDHKGQVAFPGGVQEPMDQNAESTVFRETFEEIGVKPEDIKLLGQLHKLNTHTGYRITPFVGIVPWPYPLQLEHEEVARVFTMPLAWLAEPGHYAYRTYQRGAAERQVIFFDPYDGELLWGVSAQIMVDFLSVIKI